MRVRSRTKDTVITIRRRHPLMLCLVVCFCFWRSLVALREAVTVTATHPGAGLEAALLGVVLIGISLWALLRLFRIVACA